jgi:hypothetical protein
VLQEIFHKSSGKSVFIIYINSMLVNLTPDVLGDRVSGYRMLTVFSKKRGPTKTN